MISYLEKLSFIISTFVKLELEVFNQIQLNNWFIKPIEKSHQFLKVIGLYLKPVLVTG